MWPVANQWYFHHAWVSQLLSATEAACLFPSSLSCSFRMSYLKSFHLGRWWCLKYYHTRIAADWSTMLTISYCWASCNSMAQRMDIKEMIVTLAALLNTLFPHISVFLIQENKVFQCFTKSMMKKGLRFKNSEGTNVRKIEVKSNTQRFVYWHGWFQDTKLAQGANQKSRKPICSTSKSDTNVTYFFKKSNSSLFSLYFLTPGHV